MLVWATIRAPVLAALLCAVLAGLAAAQDYLTGDALRSAFSGKTVHAPEGPGEARIYYAPGGRFETDGAGPRGPRAGDWWVADAGLLCRKYAGGTVECARAVVEGDMVSFHTLFGKPLGAGTLLDGRRLAPD